MDTGYQAGYSFSEENNHASGTSHLPQVFFDQTTSSTSMQIPDSLSASESPHFPFNPHLSASHDFSSAPLVDYSIFDMPVDISWGELPPRSTSSRALAQGRIPRPRNAFMLFRSAFHRERRLTKAVEKDHRHISRIIGLCWAELPDAEKEVWRQKAELEKQQHALAYPDYRFKPTPRTKQPIKRNVKRNSPKEIERCRKIARLIQDGKSGEELTHAVKRMEDQVPSTIPHEGGTTSNRCQGRTVRRQNVSQHFHSGAEHPQALYVTNDLPSGYHPAAASEPPPFRSPLLPPAEFPQLPSKQPPKRASPESASIPSVHPTMGGHPLEESTDFYLPGACQQYMPHEVNRTMKLHQPLQRGQQPILEWPAKDTGAMTYVQVDQRRHFPVSYHYTHYPLLSGKGTATHGLYAPTGHALTGTVDWSTFYGEDPVPSLEGPVLPASGTYDVWSNSNTNSNASASPVQLESPITAL